MIPTSNPPANPKIGEPYSFGNKTFMWNGTAWVPIDLETLTFMNMMNVKTIKRVLTRAEIIALHTTPVTLVSAPGTNKMIVGVGLLVSTKYNQIAYTGTGTTALKVNGIAVSGNIAAGTIAVAANRVEFAQGLALASVVDTNLVDKALTLVASSAFTSTAEDANNKCSTVTVVASYMVLPTA